MRGRLQVAGAGDAVPGPLEYFEKTKDAVCLRGDLPC